MPPPPSTETVRLMFEARQEGNVRAVCRLVHPDIEARSVFGPVVRGIDAVRAYFADQDAARRTEVHAHRIEADGDDVVAYGRIRTIDGRSLADSPAAWRLRVRDGMVVSIAPELP